MWNRLGAGFLCVLGRYGTPWMRLKAKRPAFMGRSGEPSAARRAVNSPWLIEAAGAAGFRSRPGAG
ncbi:hypothetical protein, partial [Bacillus amyloliquefaciens]|uniref:hypothetical protein n=1 Tax=Bacillus amyloliquefaciens TaxID=1390 RepID=UPI001CD5EEE9